MIFKGILNFISMKILHINANDHRGGATLALLRLHQALRHHQIDSKLLVTSKCSDDNSIQEIQKDYSLDPFKKLQLEIIQDIYRDQNRSDHTNTHFSLSLDGINLSQHPLINEADIIHLHWINSFQTPALLKSLLLLEKPFVWTLHDFGPFTGGCHFPAGCIKFQDSCSNCSQLKSDPFKVTAAMLQDKKSWTLHNLNLVAPSKWMATQAQESSLFRDNPIHTIANGIDTQSFHPMSKQEARSLLGLPKEGIYILCGSDQGDEKRKGFELLYRVLYECFKKPHFASSNIKILWVGEKFFAGFKSDLPTIFLGQLDMEKQMAAAYSAADLFILPSYEDNLPNMLLEALSCGTPVIAFAVGGIPEILTDGLHGRLISPFDENEMINAIDSLLSDTNKLQNMGAACRLLIEDNFSSELLVSKHLELYTRILSNYNKQKIAVVPSNIKSISHIEEIFPNLALYCLTTAIQNLKNTLALREQDCYDRLIVIQTMEQEQVKQLELLKNQEVQVQNLANELSELSHQYQILRNRMLKGRIKKILRPLKKFLKLISNNSAPQ